jgi:hypothetical protein
MSPTWRIWLWRRCFFLASAPAWRNATASLVKAAGGMTVLVSVTLLNESE